MSAPWNTFQFDPDRINRETIPVRQLIELEVETGVPGSPTVHALVSRAEEPDGLLVMFTSGRPADREPRATNYDYWKHHARFRGMDVIYISDPALKTPGDRRLTYALHNTFDGIQSITECLKLLVPALGHSEEGITFYGYSQGGFIALQVASQFPLSKAYAHVPVLDVVNGHFGAREIMEQAMGENPDEFLQKYPERNSVWQRFKSADQIPQFTITTDRSDVGCDPAFELVQNCISHGDEFSSIGAIDIQVNPEPVGHNPLPMDVTVEKILKICNQEPKYDMGRKSARSSSLILRGAQPDFAEMAHINDLAIEHPHEIDENMAWFQLERPVSKIDMTFKFENAEYDGPQALILAYGVEGLRQSDYDKMPLALSRISTIKFFHYIPAKKGDFEYRTVKDLPAGVTITSIGVQTWAYESKVIRFVGAKVVDR
ncbi:hypothetical protein QVA66_10985 [Staphylococcus chromogenes]|nr:hypothetical protein [Staphylococcus chromogenes]